MLSSNIKAPPGCPRPDFIGMAKKAARERTENQWFTTKPRKFLIGINDSDNDEEGSSADFFAWDNERNPYEVSVNGFEAQARPVSIGEYAAYLVETSQKYRLPITWTHRAKSSDEVIPNGQDGDGVKDFIDSLATRTVYGHIPLQLALDWPVYTSFDEAKTYADWVGARIPTIHEARSIHRQVEEENSEKQQSVQYPSFLNADYISNLAYIEDRTQHPGLHEMTSTQT